MANLIRSQRSKLPARPARAPSPARGLRMVGVGITLAGVSCWLLYDAFLPSSYRVGARAFGMSIGILVMGVVIGIAFSVDGILRLTRFGAERLSWERVLGVDGDEDRIVNELLIDVVGDARRIPGDESRGELRVIARRHLKKAGIRGAPLVEYLAHRLATEANVRLA